MRPKPSTPCLTRSKQFLLHDNTAKIGTACTAVSGILFGFTKQAPSWAGFRLGAVGTAASTFLPAWKLYDELKKQLKIENKINKIDTISPESFAVTREVVREELNHCWIGLIYFIPSLMHFFISLTPLVLKPIKDSHKEIEALQNPWFSGGPGIAAIITGIILTILYDSYGKSKTDRLEKEYYRISAQYFVFQCERQYRGRDIDLDRSIKLLDHETSRMLADETYHGRMVGPALKPSARAATAIAPRTTPQNTPAPLHQEEPSGTV